MHPPPQQEQQPSSAASARGPVTTGSLSASYGDIFTLSSFLAAPVPLDKFDKSAVPESGPRASQPREKQPQRTNSTSQAVFPSHNRFSRHSRSSSGSQVSSRSSHETVLPPTSSRATGPAAAEKQKETQRKRPTTAATFASPTTASVASTLFLGHEGYPHPQLFRGIYYPPPPPPPPPTSSSLPPSSASTSASTSSTTRSSSGNYHRSPSQSGKAALAFPRLHRAKPPLDRAGSLVDLPATTRHASVLPDQDTTNKAAALRQMSGLNTRAESISSTSGNTSISSRTLPSSDPSAAGDSHHLLASRPFVQRNGRTFLNDMSLPYPLPSDLSELHRQTLRTLLLIQVFGAPVCSPSLTKKPPLRVLELGCGSGFWSMMCHQYFKSRGHGGISFTGIDIAPLAPDSSTSTSAAALRPDPDMKWRFVQHDLRSFPWPLPDEEFDLIMIKDMSLATTNKLHQANIDECIRMLRPGGTMEFWESDHLIRMLRPHVPSSTVTAEDADEQLAASSLGAYVINANTPLSAPLNPYLIDYNQWLTRALEARDITAVPCTVIAPALLQEMDVLADIHSRRLAIPLSEFRWEREGVGGVITRDGKPESKGKEPPPPKVDRKPLTAGQIALRQTALLTVVQQVQGLEPILREVSGKSQDEWDVWSSKMMSDLMSDNGTSWGESLEVGAWYARKRMT